MPVKPHLIIRADASARMGIGHVMRCLALAQAWQDLGGSAALLSHQLPLSLIERLSQEGVEHLPLVSLEDDAARTCAEAEAADWVVMDGYHFTAAHVHEVAQSNANLLILDDLGQFTRGPMALILNQNISSDLIGYSQHEGNPGLLLGGRFSLLRREFRCRPMKRDFIEPCQRVLVTLGGSDPQQISAKVIHALFKIPNLHARIVVGAVNERMESLRALCMSSGGRLELLSEVREMAPLMDWAQLAVSAGGSSVLELASRGLPTLLIIAANNQQAVCECLGGRGIMLNAGWHDRLDSDQIAQLIKSLAEDAVRRATMAQRGLRIADGYGALRVAREMLARSAAAQISLRPAEASDVRMVFEWASDRRSFSLASIDEFIDWPAYRSWFLSDLQSDCCRIWIARNPGGQAVGMVAFRVKEGREAALSLHMNPEFPDSKTASAVLLVACRDLIDSGFADQATAQIKRTDIAAFRNLGCAGFRELESPLEMVGGETARMVWD